MQPIISQNCTELNAAIDIVVAQPKCDCPHPFQAEFHALSFTEPSNHPRLPSTTYILLQENSTPCKTVCPLWGCENVSFFTFHFTISEVKRDCIGNVTAYATVSFANGDKVKFDYGVRDRDDTDFVQVFPTYVRTCHILILGMSHSPDVGLVQ